MEYVVIDWDLIERGQVLKKLTVAQLREEAVACGCTYPVIKRKDPYIQYLVQAHRSHPRPIHTVKIRDLVYRYTRFAVQVTVRNAWVFLPTEDRNIYTLLSPESLEAIAQIREVNMVLYPDKAAALHQLDTIEPTWINNIRNWGIQTLIQYGAQIDFPRLYISMLLHGINHLELLAASKFIYNWDIVPTYILLRHTPRITETPSPNRYVDRDLLGSMEYIYNEAVIYHTVITSGLEDIARELSTPASGVRGVLIELAQHPPRREYLPYAVYMYVRKISRDVLDAVLNILGVTEYRFMTSEEKIFTLTRGYYPVGLTLRLATRQARYIDLQKLSRFQLVLLAQLYGVADGNDMTSDIAAHPPCVMEAFVRALPTETKGSTTYLDIAKRLGILVPDGSPVSSYVMDNIVHYASVWLRDPGMTLLTLKQVRDSKDPRAYLSLFTDMELLEVMFGVRINYRSRPELLDHLTMLLREPMFFISWDPKQRRCRNDTSAFLNSVLDPRVDIICFGTIFDHIGYEPLELEYAFGHVDREDTKSPYLFRRPENTKLTFTSSQVMQLRYMLKVEELVKMIDHGLYLERSYTDQDAGLVKAFRDCKGQSLIRTYLITLFQAGMYMRRWEGPGCPYPITDASTYKMVGPEQRSSEALASLYEIKEKLGGEHPAFTVVEYDTKGRSIRSSTPLNAVLTNIANFTLCIRIGSSYLIWTSVFYLDLLFHETIPGFPDPSKLVKIL